MKIASLPDDVRHVVYADVDSDGRVRYVGKGTRSRYFDEKRSYWGRSTWRPERRIILYTAGSDEAIRVLESVAIRQHLDAGADLLNVRQPSIPDLAAAVEARRRASQSRRRREKERRRRKVIQQGRFRLEREERLRLEQTEFEEVLRRMEKEDAEEARRLGQEKQRIRAEAKAAYQRLQDLWARRDAGLEPDAGKGLGEPFGSWGNPIRKIWVAHLRAVGPEIRAEYRSGRTRWAKGRGYRTPPKTSSLVLAELLAASKTIPGRTAIVSVILMLILVALLIQSNVI